MARTISVAALAVAVLSAAVFQNCANNKIGSAAKGTATSASQSGGEPYEGKLFLSEEKCPNLEPSAIIRYLNANSAMLTRRQCQNLNPEVPLTGADFQVDPQDNNKLYYATQSFWVEGTGPQGTPQFSADFADIIGASVNTLYTAQTVVTGFTGQYQAAVSSGGEVSTDSVNWAAQVTVSSGATIYVRQFSGGPNETRTVNVVVGTSSADWTVSTVSSVRVYSAPGSYAESRMNAGRFLRVECWGAGGSGGSGGGAGFNGGGGGGGGYSMIQIPRASLGLTETVVVGAGGASVPAGFNITGGPGGASSFGSHMSAGGGAGGLSAAAGSGAGAGGTGVTNMGANGQTGGEGSRGGSAGGPSGGAGGAAPGGAGSAPGGGGAGGFGAGGGGPSGNGSGATGAGGGGRCVTTIIP